MTGWGDDSVLVDLVERQFDYLDSLTGPERLLFLPRLLDFIEREPRLTAILEDLRHEAAEVLSEFRRAHERIRTELSALWSAHAAELRTLVTPALADPNNERQLSTFARIESYEARLAELPFASFPSPGNASDLESDTGKLILALKQWRSWALERKRGNVRLSGGLAQLDRELEALEREHSFAARSLHSATRTMAWPAIERLRGVRARVLPVPPKRGPDVTADDSVLELVRYRAEDVAARVVHGDANPTREGQVGVQLMADEVAEDARTLREELLLRIGLARSRISLVRRYAARCEAFDAERLRAACAEASSHAERILTLDFARFLFDAGLTPLLEATASGLRPDVLHLAPSSLFYVEAKQYDGTGAKAQLRKAYAQVWSTWARLRKIYPCDEAFLVVFRRGGPYVELPAVIRWAGLRLYSVVADISTEAGSREKTRVELITESDLQPAPEEEK